MRAQAVIDLSALAHNLLKVRELAPNCTVYAAIKANAYGHGALPAARALAQADGFAVATLDEALYLRRFGINQPIMLLSHSYGANELALMAEQHIECTVFHASQLALLANYQGPTLKYWGMIDTGMHRLGFLPEDVAQAAEQLASQAHLECVGWMSHLACADDIHSRHPCQQIECFKNATSGLPGTRSLANSAAIVGWPQAHTPVIRPGIMLYGSSPMLGQMGQEIGLQPAMTLTAPLLAINTIAAGEPVGYGGTWVTPEAMPIGIVGIGYGDGYPRHADSGTPVLVGGQQVATIGRVAMDMIAIDLRGVSSAAVGDRVILWGRGLPAEQVAQHVGTISYELFCQLTSRVEFKYINNPTGSS